MRQQGRKSVHIVKREKTDNLSFADRSEPMANILNSIDLGLMSLKNFESKALAYDVFSAIEDAGPQFFPTVYDVYEPLHHKCNKNDVDELVRVWVNEENAEVTSQNRYGMGQLLMEHRRKPKIAYQMYWEKSQQERFNYFIMSADSEFLMDSNNLKNFLTLCQRLIILLEPVQGEIVNCAFPGWDVPINLQVRHPELHWMAFFGKPYIELFGRDKLLNAPCYSTESIGSDIIALQMTESPFHAVTDEMRNAVKTFLDPEAFVENGKSYRAYKTGHVPSFDFTNVLFDKNAPVIQPSIRMRNIEV